MMRFGAVRHNGSEIPARMSSQSLNAGTQAIADIAGDAMEKAVEANGCVGDELGNILMGGGVSVADVRLRADRCAKWKNDKKNCGTGGSVHALPSEDDVDEDDSQGGSDDDPDDAGAGPPQFPPPTGSIEAVGNETPVSTPVKCTTPFADLETPERAYAKLHCKVVVTVLLDCEEIGQAMSWDACTKVSPVEPVDDDDGDGAASTASLGSTTCSASKHGATAAPTMMRTKTRGIVRAPEYWIDKLNIERAMMFAVDQRITTQAFKCLDREREKPQRQNVRRV